MDSTLVLNHVFNLDEMAPHPAPLPPASRSQPGPRATAWRTLQKRGTQPGGAQGAVGEAVGDRQVEVAGGWLCLCCPFLPAMRPESLLLAAWPTLELFKGSSEPWHRGPQCFPGRDGIWEVGERSSSWADCFQLCDSLDQRSQNLWTYSHLPSPNSGPCCPERENAFPKVTPCTEPGLT